MKNLTGFHYGQWWSCYHLDELNSLDNTGGVLEDVRTNVRRPLSDWLCDQGDNALSAMYKRLVHGACSLIVDTDLRRTMSRIEVLVKLTNNAQFLRALNNRVVLLQRLKEDTFPDDEMKVDWLKRVVIKPVNMNNYSTLRAACDNYLESALVRILAYVLSCVDAYSNLDVYVQARETNSLWIADVWLRMLLDEIIFPIKYDDMKFVFLFCFSIPYPVN